MADPPGDRGAFGHRAVVGAAIVRDGCVLAARRKVPVELAGRWEFPGGKVERHESEPAALVRECQEELGVFVAIKRLLGRAPISDRLDLSLYGASLISGEPTPGVAHDVLRWLTSTQLDDVDWLDADRTLLTGVSEFLSITT